MNDTEQKIADWCKAMQLQKEQFINSTAEGAGYPAEAIANVYESIVAVITEGSYDKALADATEAVRKHAKSEFGRPLGKPRR